MNKILLIFGILVLPCLDLYCSWADTLRLKNSFHRRVRRGIANLVIINMLFFSFLDLATNREDFPFAPFNMYSKVYRGGENGKPKYETLTVAFVSAENVEFESKDEYLYPFDRIRFTKGLSKVIYHADQLKSRLKEALRINQLLSKENSSLPKFTGIRLYYQKNASNLYSPLSTGSLTQVILVAQYVQGES